MNEEVKKMFEGFGFKIEEVPEEITKQYEGHEATWVVKVTSDGSSNYHLLICSVFKDGYKFAVMDKVGIIQLITLKPETPVGVLKAYIMKAAEFFAI